MHIWSHRIIRYNSDTVDEYYQIHEVVYDEYLRPISLGPAFCPKAQDVELLSHQMIHAMSAFTRPILEYSHIAESFTDASAQTASDLLRPKNV